jgi:DNA-binding response OmpR family regulator
MATTVLLAGDRRPLAGFLEEQLRRAGFEIVGSEGRPDVVLAASGGEIDRWSHEAAVIVLGTPGAEPGEGARAFRSGCDDYMAEPSHYEELVERIRAVLRRSRPSGSRIVIDGLLEIDQLSRVVSVRGIPLRVSQKEFALLTKLATDPGRVFTKGELLREIWGHGASSRTRTLDSHASRLRRKLRALDSTTRYVDNEWGVGYRLVGPFPES